MKPRVPSMTLELYRYVLSLVLSWGSLVTLLALVSKALLQLVLRRKCMVEMGAVMQFICLKSENPDHCRRPLTADCQSSIAQLRRVVRP